MAGKSVLIVEDDGDMRKMIKLALQLNKYEVQDVASAKEAFQALSKSPCPDLILLDMNLGDMIGNEFMVKLKKVPGCENIKVVLISGIDDLTTQAQQIGVDGYIKKPFELTTLNNEIAKHLSKK